MSSAFALQPSGSPALPQKPELVEKSKPRTGTCEICGARWLQYDDPAHPLDRICDSRDCLLELLRRESPAVQPLLCRCPQRPYAHELSVHKLLRRESFNPKHRYKWPWSLCLSDRVEISAEDR